MGEEPPEEDVFNILIATDNHLGYGEKKPELQQDSFRTFEEILQIAVKNEVDFILLGGDLFHESQPSSYCMYRCTELLKQYCVGDKPVEIEFLSDQSENFSHLKNPIVNYEDPNLNVSIPIFSIHGNHDSPSGSQLISALDILSSNGLINYFGRWTDLSEIEIRPILLKKGKTKLAIYGLSHIPDQRLARLFLEKKVKMPRVDEDDWFNILVLHQNRANRGIKNFIPYNVIPSFINLVIWGHEHDCNIQPTQHTPDGPWICQPGSSVATSLSEGESSEKYVGLLKVYKEEFKLIPIRLKSVRPFIFGDIVLCKPDSDEFNLEDPKQQAIDDVKKKAEEMIKSAKIKQEGSGNTSMLPLIRLIVKYYDESQIFNCIRLGHEFENKVSNPGDMFKIHNFIPREREKKTDAVGGVDEGEFEDMDDWANRVEDVVEQYFKNSDRGSQMSVLSVKLMTKAVSRCVDFGDVDAMKTAFESQVNKTVNKLVEKNPDCDDIAAALRSIKQERLRDEDKEVAEMVKEFEKGLLMDTGEINISDDEVVVLADSSTKSVRGKATRGAKGTRRPRGRGSRAN